MKSSIKIIAAIIIIIALISVGGFYYLNYQKLTINRANVLQLTPDILTKEITNSFEEKIKIFTKTFQSWCGGDCIDTFQNCTIKVYDHYEKEILNKNIERCEWISDVVTDSVGNFYFYDYHEYPISLNPADFYKYSREENNFLIIPDISLSESRCGSAGRGLYYNPEKDSLWLTYLTKLSNADGRQTSREICSLNLAEIKNLRDFQKTNVHYLGSLKVFDSKIDGRLRTLRINDINANKYSIIWAGAFYPLNYPDEPIFYKNFTTTMQIIENIKINEKTQKQIYKNEKNGFELELPESWFGVSEELNEASHIVFSKYDSIFIPKYSMVMIRVIKNNEKTTAKSWWQKKIEGDGMEYVSQGNILINGDILAGKYKEKDRPWSIYAVFNNNSDLYLISGLVSDDQLFNRILNSFRFIK